MPRIREEFDDLDTELPDQDTDELEGATDDESEDIFSETNSRTHELDDEEILELVEQQKAEMEALLARKGIQAGRKDEKSGKGAKGLKEDKTLEWKPANTLDAPPPRPGKVQRWVRFQIGDKDDPRNWSRAQREGWSPRPVDTISSEFGAPTMNHAQFGTVVQVGDVILCEMDERLYKSRKKFFANKAKRQREAMEKRPMQGTPIKVEENKRSVTYGRRRAAATEE